MGLQNALFVKNIPFTSDDAVEFNDEFMEAIVVLTKLPVISRMSVDYSTYQGSKWDRGLLPQDAIDARTRG